MESKNNAINVNVIHTMLDEDGHPIEEIFSPDMKQMKSKGYAGWTAVVKPLFMKIMAERLTE